MSISHAILYFITSSQNFQPSAMPVTVSRDLTIIVSASVSHPRSLNRTAHQAGNEGPFEIVPSLTRQPLIARALLFEIKLLHALHHPCPPKTPIGPARYVDVPHEKIMNIQTVSMWNIVHALRVLGTIVRKSTSFFVVEYLIPNENPPNPLGQSLSWLVPLIQLQLPNSWVHPHREYNHTP